MKYLKLFEGWSDQYLHDFTDEEKFTIEEDGKKVKGEYRGPFDTVDMTNSFADAVSKISSDYKILKAQSFFNQVTGNAKFEIEVQNYESEFIEIDTPSGKVKFMPERIVNIWSNIRERVCHYFHIEGRLENGTKKTVYFDFYNGDNVQYRARTLDDIKMKVTIGNKYRGVSIDKENVSKLLEMIAENKISKGIWGDIEEQERQNQNNRGEILEIGIENLRLFAN
jgi:hypothetical protein